LEKKIRNNYKIRPFKFEKDKYWINFLPYEIINGEPINLNGFPLADKESIKRLKEYIN